MNDFRVNNRILVSRRSNPNKIEVKPDILVTLRVGPFEPLLHFFVKEGTILPALPNSYEKAPTSSNKGFYIYILCMSHKKCHQLHPAACTYIQVNLQIMDTGGTNDCSLQRGRPYLGDYALNSSRHT